MPISRSQLTTDYYLIITPPKQKTVFWSWEIRRRSMPLGVRIYNASFKSESAAKLAGEKALRDLLNRIFNDLD
jgi:hypothetical protein